MAVPLFGIIPAAVYGILMYIVLIPALPWLRKIGTSPAIAHATLPGFPTPFPR
jgi:hypothetical protein